MLKNFWWGLRHLTTWMLCVLPSVKKKNQIACPYKTAAKSRHNKYFKMFNVFAGTGEKIQSDSCVCQHEENAEQKEWTNKRTEEETATLWTWWKYWWMMDALFVWKINMPAVFSKISLNFQVI